MTSNDNTNLPPGMTEELWASLSPEVQDALQRHGRGYCTCDDDLDTDCPLHDADNEFDAIVKSIRPSRVRLNPDTVLLAAKLIRESVGTERDTWSIADVCEEIGWVLNDDEWVMLDFINGLASQDGISVLTPCTNCGSVLIIPDPDDE